MAKRKSKTNKRPTLTQVAELAGVKLSTASEILNRRSNSWSSQATKDRVFEAAKTLGYRPNLAAQSLRSGKTRTIGMIFASHEGSRRMAGLDNAAHKESYAVVSTFNANDPRSEDQLILSHLDRGVDGLVVYPSDEGPHTELRKLVESGFPVVTLDGAGRLDFECNDVSPDYHMVGRIQAQHVLSLNRRKVCVITTEPNALVNTFREKGIAEELASHHAPEALVMKVKFRSDQVEVPTVDDIYPQIMAFLKRHNGAFDAVISVDSLAVVAARAVLAQGLKIPEDVVIVGAANSALSSHSILPMTSVDTADEWIGGKAFELLFEAINRKRPSAQFQRVYSLPQLIVRQSSQH